MIKPKHYWIKRIYWKLIGRNRLSKKVLEAEKIDKLLMKELLDEWRYKRSVFDGAEYDKREYWIH